MKITEIIKTKETATYEVLITNENGIGGYIGDVFKDIEKCLKKEGHEVEVLTFMPVSNTSVMATVKAI